MTRTGHPVHAVLMSVAALLLVGACTTMPETTDEFPVVDRTGDVLPGDGEGVPPCAAETYQSLVGQMIGEVHTESLPHPLRIYSTDMSVTMDYRPDRLNIVHTPDGRILEVKCG